MILQASRQGEKKIYIQKKTSGSKMAPDFSKATPKANRKCRNRRMSLQSERKLFPTYNSLPIKPSI